MTQLSFFPSTLPLGLPDFASHPEMLNFELGFRGPWAAWGVGEEPEITGNEIKNPPHA